MSQPSQNNGVSYKIYIYLQEYTESPPSEIQCQFHDIQTSTRTTSTYSRHSAVSSCPSHFLAPPTPPFPLNPWPRRQRDRVATAWLQLSCLAFSVAPSFKTVLYQPNKTPKQTLNVSAFLANHIDICCLCKTVFYYAVN